MTSALPSPFQVVAGIEIEPDYADLWQAAHPDALLVQSDLRGEEERELPEFDVLIGDIPCTSHSDLGRAKKGLAGWPERGDTGDLFLAVLSLVAQRMPVAVVLENVPSFGSSLAGELMTEHLRRLGYQVAVQVLEPNAEWGVVEDRRRWLLVATLNQPFTLRVPGLRCDKLFASFLDEPEAMRDRTDADRIARTIAGCAIIRRGTRRKAMGLVSPWLMVL